MRSTLPIALVFLSIANSICAQTFEGGPTRIPGSFTGAGVTANFGEVMISVIPPTSGDSTHGYKEYIATIVNRAGAPRRVELSFPAGRGSATGDHIKSISCEKEVGPGATIRMSLFQPDKPSLGGGNGIRVVIDGQPQRDPLPVALNQSGRGMYSPRYRYGTPMTTTGTPRSPEVFVSPRFVPPPGFDTSYVLRSRAIKSDFIHQLHTMGGATHVVREENFPMHALPASEWSPHWLGYSSYDGIIIMGDEIVQMGEGARNALWQYVETGGTLTVLGKLTPPEHWKLATKLNPKLTVYYPAFGQCFVSETRDANEWTDQAKLEQISAWSHSAAPWKNDRSAGEANKHFPVIEDAGIPVRGLFILMVGFVALIGPINLLYLSRRKKRIWMLWTVPVISFLTCAAVFGYMLVSEGWNAHARTDVITLLDENARRATTIGWTGFYSPLTPSGGLRFSPETEVTAQISDDYYRRDDSGAARTLDWTTDQHLGAGWVTARTPAQFMVRKSESRRERVDITRAPQGGLSIVNGLGADLVSFWYADANGKIFTSGPLAAGATATLNATSDQTALNSSLETEMRQLFSGGYQSAASGSQSILVGMDWLRCVERIATTPRITLQPGRYVAVLNSAPFIDEGMKAKYRNERTIVIGIPKEAGREG